MKKLSVLLAVMALFFTDLVLAANNAVVTSLTGAVQVQTGSAPARPLRQGDELSQGDTVITGPASSAVLKFDDGQVAALTANSRMTVTAYAYNPANESGNVLLSLVTGGMRVITGIIGRRTPDRVTYRAATATIGVRGSDGTIITAQNNVVVTVREGAFVFTMNNQTVVIPAGQAIHARPDGTFNRGAIAAIADALRGTPAGAQILEALGGINGLAAAVNAAAPGTARQGQDGGQGNQGNQGNQGGQSGGQGGGQGGGGGGGRPSGS